MKKKYIKSIFLFCLISMSAWAQDLYYADYDWEQTPEAYTPEATVRGELILKNKRVVEFDFEGENFYEYYLHHKIIYVNSDEAIERNNRVYIPTADVEEVLNQKARVITSSGKVLELDESDILEAKDEENKQSFRYFALEGVDKGSRIEYLFLFKKYPEFRGARVLMQSETEARDVSFDLISPAYLKPKVKSYNGLPELLDDSLLTEKYRFSVHMDSVPALDEEMLAPYRPNLMQFMYKLDRNTQDNRELASFGFAAENVHKSIYMEQSKSLKKKLSKLVKEIGISKKDDEISKLRKLDHYIKSNFAIGEAPVAELADLPKVLENKAANTRGALKLYVALLDVMKIDHRIVLTVDRNRMKFDPDFEAFCYLSDYLLYFPAIDMYTSPTDISLRMGFVPAELTHNYGLFIKSIELNNFKTGIGTVRYIEPMAYDQSASNLFVTLDFNEAIDEPVIDIRTESSGYNAQFIQTFYDLLDEATRKEVVEGMIKSISQDAELEEVNSSNTSGEDFGVKPMIVSARFSSADFVEKAGRKYLFKLGELIGPQMEMYQEEERKLNVESRFTRSYHREIQFEIPENYKISNLEDLNMDVYHEEEGERTMSFQSSYTLEGNTVTVVIDEYYKNIEVELEDFEAYRKVINAAADFNKIVLFIEG